MIAARCRSVAILALALAALTGPSAANAAGIVAGYNHTCAVEEGRVWCWGNNFYGQVGPNGALSGGGSVYATPAPTNLFVSPMTITALAAGSQHTCAALGGSAYCWGLNINGQLGNGVSGAGAFTSEPQQVTGLQSGVTAMAGGKSHTCAVVNGGAWCWGLNQVGQLGNNSTTGSSVPVPVNGLASGVTAIVAGEYFTCALVNGGVRCWGRNADGQLGDASNVDSPVPVQVGGLTSGVSSIAAGDWHACAIHTSGTFCWGYNGYGQLGRGDFNSANVPVSVLGLPSAATSISAGVNHTCAALANGAAMCWGTNSDNQIGNGAGWANNYSLPQQVTGLTSNVLEVVAGFAHACATVYLEGVKCWGWNESGQLGNNTTGNWSPVPSQNVATVVVDKIGAAALTGVVTSNPAAINCGSTCKAPFTFNQTVVLTAYAPGSSVFVGWISCDYIDGNGNCVVNPQIGRVITAEFQPGFRLTVSRIGSGSGNVASSSGGIACGTNGAVCTANYTNNFIVTLTATPLAGSTFAGWSGGGCSGTGTCNVTMNAAKTVFANFVPTTPLPPVTVSAGSDHTCAVIGGAAKCWGLNGDGQLGNGTNTDSAVPVQVFGLTSGVTAIAAGHKHSCAIHNGAAKCWGMNSSGQLGDTTQSQRQIPVQVNGQTSGVTLIAAGESHTCLVRDGAAACWGWGFYGQLGHGSQSQSLTPVPVAGLLTTDPSLSAGVSAIAAGRNFTCAVVDGAAKCWGHNVDGQIGDGTTTNRLVFTQVTGLTSGVTAIDGGYSSHACALVNGATKCWGINQGGQLGNGSLVQSLVPVSVTGAPSSSVGLVATGGFHSCAKVFDRAECWGVNNDGQVGNGSTSTTSPTATAVTGLGMGITQLGLGYSHSCAIVGGGVKCWGLNAHGQLGNGTTTSSSVPVVAIAGTNVTLTLTKNGTGAGTVASVGGYIICGPTCAFDFTNGYSVELIAGASSGSVFSGWTGCDSVDGNNHCIVAMTSARGVTATFNVITAYPLSISPAGTGGGTVTSSPGTILCGVVCQANFAPGTVVTLQATAAGGSVFSGWSGGGCSGTGTCQVTMNAPITVTATFNVAPSAAPRSGFNGDARSDVFWRDSTGGFNYQWQMNGLAMSGQGYMVSVPANWAAAGIGDMNNDGIADVFWREAGGLNYLWMMDGLAILSQGYLPSVPNPWIVVGLGDANGDGMADVFWRNPTTGQNYLWIMNGLSIASQGYLPSVAGPDWEAVGVADYSGDGKADVFWRNKTTGQNYLWLMNGLVVSSQGFLTTIPSADWEVVGSPDANADGKADALWRNKVTGQNYLWVMNGLAIASQGYLPSVTDVNWKVVGFGDYDGDGKGDVLWRNATTGQNYLWTLNGIAVASQGYLPSVAGANWKPAK